MTRNCSPLDQGGWLVPTVDDDGNKVPDPQLPDTSTGSSDSSGGGEDVQTFNVSTLPFKFNPPLHSSLRFVRANLGEVGKATDLGFYDEKKNKYDAKLAVREDGKKTGFENLRLGRIIMDDMAVSKGVIESGSRYGFRFLYNPAQLGGTLNVGTDFIPNQQSSGSAVLQKGLENLQLEVLLNRIPDLNGRGLVSEYTPNISEGTRKRIQAEGTHYDLDFLYRCANGIHDTRQQAQTGDIGVLLPNPCRLILGPYTSRGAVTTVQVSDQMFSRDMVPILSYVNITFSRFLNMSPEEIDRAESYGITQDGADGNSGGSSGGGGGSDEPGQGGVGGDRNLDTNNRPTYSITFNGVRGTSAYGHKVHAAVASAFPWQDKNGGFFDYAAGDSNHGTGRALDIMQESVQPKDGGHRGWGIANFLKARADSLYVTQVIFQRKIWTWERKGEGWRPMADRGSNTANHYDHVHVSFGPGSGNEDRSRHLTLTTSDEYWR